MKGITVVFMVIIFFSSCVNSNSQKDKNIVWTEESLKGYKDIIGGGIIQEGEINISTNFITLRVPGSLEDSAISISNLIKEVRYVKLETTSNSLIGAIDKLYLSDNRIIVIDKRKAHSVFIFDKSGKFLLRINRMGKGPGEFEDITDACYNNDTKQIIIYDEKNRRISYFSIEGKFLKSVRTGFFFNSFEYLGNNIYAHYVLYDFNPHIEKINTNNIVLTKDCQNIISTFYEDKNLYPQISNFTKNQSLQKHRDNCFFSPVYSDTIFRILSKPTSMEAVFKIDLNDNVLSLLNERTTLNEFTNLKEKYYYFLGRFLDLDRALYFEIQKKNTFGIFYSKKTGKIIGGDRYVMDNRLNIEYFAFPRTTIGDEFVGILDPAFISLTESGYKKYDPDRLKKRSPEIKSLLNSLSDIDNPVLMYYRLKDF